MGCTDDIIAGKIHIATVCVYASRVLKVMFLPIAAVIQVASGLRRETSYEANAGLGTIQQGY